MNNTILIVAAHPDDEVLGMGGAIARYVHAGDAVYVLFLGDGVTSRGEMKEKEVLFRRDCAEQAARILGANIFSFGTFPDNRFDTVSFLDIVQFVEKAKNEVRPDKIFTHHGGDLNIDHRLTLQAVLTAFRPQPQERFSAIYSFEVNSSTEWSHPAILPVFVPDTFVDIAPFVKKKLEAYSCYEAEVRPDPHARSLKAVECLAQKRGREVGLEYAEAFMTLRHIVR